MSRSRGNGTGSITSYKTAKGKRKYRVRISAGVYFDEEAEKVKTVCKYLGVFDTKAEAEAALAEYNNSPYDLTTKIVTAGDLYDAWSKEYFEKVAPSAVRSVTSAWAYCDDIAKLPLKKLGNRNLHISGFLSSSKVDIEDKKVDIETKKVDIETKKVDIESLLAGKVKDFSVKTVIHIHRLFEKFGFDEVFGRSAVMETLELKSSGASKFLSNLLDAEIIEPVSGFGKGKYKFKK